MLPDRVVEVLRTAPFMAAGTRDAANRPSCHIVGGVVVHDDRAQVTAFVPAHTVGALRENAASNGRFALTVGLASGESYQLKGRITEVRHSSADDHSVLDASLENIVASCRGMLPDALLDAVAEHAFHPAVAVTFSVDEVFTQTPGPGAGEPTSGSSR